MPGLAVADRNLVRRFVDQLGQARAAHFRTDQIVVQSIAYSLSNQYSIVDKYLALSMPEVPTGYNLIKAPLIPRAVDAKVSKLSGSRPIWDCVATQSSAESVRSAETKQIALRWMWQITDMDRHYPIWAWWMMNSPRAWLKVWWDPKAGKSSKRPVMSFDPMTMQPIPAVDPFTGQPQFETAWTGLPRIQPVSWFEMVWDPLAQWEGDARWCDHGQVMAIADAEARFGVLPGAEPFEGSNRFWRVHTIQSMREQSTFTGSASPVQMDSEEKCVVHERQIKPGDRDFPQGAIIWHTQDDILGMEEPFPYEHGELTYVGASERTVGGGMNGDFLTHRGIDVQDELNRRLRQMSAHGDIVADPIFVADELDSEIEALGVGPGRKIKANLREGQGPHWETPGVLGPEVQATFAAARDLLWEIMEVNTLSQDVNQYTSGAALTQRIEADEGALGQTRASVQHALIRAARMMISNFKHKMIAPMQICVLGSSAKDDIRREVSKDDFAEDCEIRVSLESQTVLSKAVRNENIMKILSFSPPEMMTPERMQVAAKAIETGALERIFDVTAEDSEFARRQLARLRETGQPEPPRGDGMNIAENLEVTEASFRSYINTEDFEALPPNIQQAITMTWSLKKQSLDLIKQQELQAQMAMAAATKVNTGMRSGGAGEGPPKNSPLTEGGASGVS